MVLESPTRLRLPRTWVGSYVEAELRQDLGYEDLKVSHELRTWKQVQNRDRPGARPHWFVAKYGRAALDAKVAELEAARYKSCLFSDERGLWTYSGFAQGLATRYSERIHRSYALPAFAQVPWTSQPYESRWYQRDAEELLVGAVHASVELATGLGKSLVICKILHRIGLPAVVIAPTLSIATQLLADATRLFGKKYVGQFFDGKKEAAKRFVIAVSKSLTNVESGSTLHQLLAAKAVLIGDESHLLPAETLSAVVLGLLGDIPYRFFLSGTQMRGDGLDKVLEGIIGPVMMHMDVKQGVDEGWLARPRFYQFEVRSDMNLDVPDAIKMNRCHLHDNPNVYRHAAGLIKAALARGRRPLVLVEQIPQFARLLPFLGSVRAGFAHGGTDARTKKLLPEAYHKSDPMALVAEFDRGDLPILVGTQCVGTGTDIKTASTIIDLVGLASEVRLRQNVGRGTRLVPGKTDCTYVDYKVWNVPKLVRHAEKRAAVFEDIYGPVTYSRGK